MRTRGIFHCFNCNASGRISDVPTLANFESKVRSFFNSDPERAQPALVSFPLGYHKLVPRGSIAYRYLAQRGIREFEIKKFEIGYTIAGVFAHRVIIPIRENGLLKYFVGRTYVGDTPKYMNAAAPKDGLVFKTFQGRTHRVVITEGVFDAISVSRVSPAISVLGKTLSQKQIDTIKASASKAVILLDADAPQDGFKAFEQLNYHMPTRIVFLHLLQGAKDPGDMTIEQIREILK